MTTIRVRISDTERTCAVDDEELGNWSKALIQDILFTAAKTVSAGSDPEAVSATVTFRVAIDPADGSLVIET